MDFRIPVTNDLLRVVSRLDALRGTWSAGVGVPSTRLDRLRDAAKVQSVAASCRLAGIRVTDAEVAALLLEPATPVRCRREILGLARAFDDRPGEAALWTPQVLRSLHAVVLGAEGDAPQPTPWRQKTASREAFSPEGCALGRVFQTLPPRMLRGKVDDLLTWIELELRSNRRHPIPVIATFVLALMAASPFDRANGRLARVLAVRLLQRAGYEHVMYASLDRVIEESRQAYYDAYDLSETRLWSGEARLEPWLDYFVGTLDEQRRRVEAALEVERRALSLSDLQRRILETVRDHGVVDAALLIQATGANRNTLKDNMRRLVRLGMLDKSGERRGTRYRLAAAAPLAGPPPGGGRAAEPGLPDG